MIRNWLLTLGIDFDPCPDDEGYLRRAINEKRDEFSLKSEGDSDQAAYYREIVDAIDAGEADDALLDWTERLDQEKQARKIVYEAINGAIENGRLLDPSFSDETAASIAGYAQKAIRAETGAATYELPQDLVDERIRRFKELYNQPGQDTVTELTGEQIDALYEKYAGVDADASKRFDGFARDLANVGAADLFEFFEKMGFANARNMQPAQLVRASQAIAQNPPSILKDLAATASAVNLAHNAEDVFGDSEKPEQYKSYLAAKKLDSVFRGVTRYVKKGGEIPRNLAVKQTEELAACIDNPQDAPAVFAGFARRNNMKMGISYGDLVRAINGEETPQAMPTMVMEEERVSASESATRMLSAMPAKTKRRIVVAIAAVIVVVIAFFAISSVVSNIQAKQQAEAEHKALIESFGEGELSEMIKAAIEEETWPIVVTDYSFTQSSPRSFEPSSLTITSRREEDGGLAVDFDAVLENGYFKQTTSGTARLKPNGTDNRWVLDSWNFSNSEAHPTRGINPYQDYDWTIPESSATMRDGYGDVDFDAQNETCAVTYRAPGNTWYGSLTGEATYRFSFGGTGWKLDKTSGELKTTYNGSALRGTYATNASTDSPGISLTIEDVNESTGAVTCSYAIEPAKGSATTAISGKAEGTINANQVLTLKLASPAQATITCRISQTPNELLVRSDAGEGLSVKAPSYLSIKK